ncbi:ataxin-7-like protein 2a [Brienomyrus brachyistius]|uniref:ataxin-7-like protein 2a n=1 Tax=Brienomyrus brachyistius TaxID=42636 RepID=UPI0020B1F837|nr:ataxin-7-like protein 2a [Brienomyrus brachyistius]
MMAVRERAAAAMAALDRWVPSLEDFVGQSWSSWVERVNAFVSEGSDGEECGKNGKKRAETMTLRREDMSMFGHCPAQDDFYLVVCSHCGQVVKPQAFERHCERRHGSLGKAHGRPPVAAAAAAPPRSRHAPPPYRPPKPQRDSARLSPPNKACHTAATPTAGGSSSRHPPSSGSPPRSPGPSLKDPPWPQGGAVSLPGGTSPSEKPQQRRGEPGRTPGGSRTYRRIRKECDLDKHCGVLDPERKKLCTRLLTCNIHSIHQRRKVLGRSKNFDQLVAELKMSSKAREQTVQAKEEPEEGPGSPDSSGEPSRRPPADCTPLRSRALWEGDTEEDRPGCEEREAQPPVSPLSHGRLSSEGSEGEGTEELPDWHGMPWHPKPIGLCTFGSRTLGPGLFTFDRRLLRLRSALSAMVEQHLGAPLWRKIPQTPEPQVQRSVTSNAAAGLAASSLSLRTSPASSQVVTPPRPAHGSQTTLPGLSRPRNPVGRPSKQQGRQREVERKRRASPQGDHASANDRNCVLQERGRTPDPTRTTHAPHGLANGTLSPGNKPRPQATPTEPHSSSLGLLKRAPPPDHTPRGPALHSRTSGHEHKGPGPGRKRKAGLPPPSKPPRPSTAPLHPGFFTWRKEGKNLEPKLSAQKPKLHH